MFTAIEIVPREELELRWARCREELRRSAPAASGLMVCSRLAIYWLSGSWMNGLFWLPVEGEPVLLVRKGIERARMESTVRHILPFRSYRDVETALREAGAVFDGCAAVDMCALPWSMGLKLQEALSGMELLSGDGILAAARARKTPWELAKLRLCGERHDFALTKVLPEIIRPGMSERDVSHAAWNVFFELGHSGPLRMGNFGEECFLGDVSAGDSGNYPTVFNGPLGLRGEHPAVPFMGYAGKIWKKGEPLVCDIGFCLEGYITDKTQVYFAGAESALTPAMRGAHAFCADVQQWLAENMKPGAVPEELYAHCVDWARRVGFADGFMGLGGNKVPFVGHGIGLVVDEFPPIAAKVRMPLEEGMVLAVEPKCGIPGVGMVGVENTFEVTPEGGRSITGHDFGIICVD
ncbi:Xaa-Pro aminopeptidase [Desulfobaculum xiamenense]|uniref:Xaa-Pro aminopeptidase n=1 Tax=Desulfobaculum xiamenense TaxID=995050 RepID=A0A846QPJ8_9BACT|nr:Xaa-Pro peptidase family protein [Desulfobaculum xiamenense]NJB67335.1 Xaa-Pro aminopeptidase [Desulfobaculum xiamenense]